jgi:ribonuclease D
VACPVNCSEKKLPFPKHFLLIDGMIDDARQLAEWLPHLRESIWVALDTEADSLHCYPEKLCLLQFSCAAGHVLVDPLADLNLNGLFQVLRGREIIMHGADYDLRLLKRCLRFVPDHIFDTMLAARFLGMREFALSALVSRFLGVKLVKGPQKAKWSRRPLPPELLDYAINDTAHLKPLADLLRAELVRAGRLSWHAEACARMIEEARRAKERDPEEAWRMAGSDRLSPRALAILRGLWHWREEEAIQANKPPFFILSHEALLQMAARAAHGDTGQSTVPTSWSERRRRSLSQALDRALGQSEVQRPRTPNHRFRRLTEAEHQRLYDLRQRRDQTARKLGLEASFIASRALLVSVACGREQSNLMEWQQDILLRGTS